MSVASQYRPLNVRDALSYLDQVKVQFYERPEVYNRFLDVMKEFKGQVIDTPGVIERVSNLFRGHPVLIQGFNTFLPPGYRIECVKGKDGNNVISVTTPAGTTTHIETRDDGPARLSDAPAAGGAAAAAGSSAGAANAAAGGAAGARAGSPAGAGGARRSYGGMQVKGHPPATAAAAKAPAAADARAGSSSLATATPAAPPAAAAAERTSGANTPNAANALAAAANATAGQPAAAAAQVRGQQQQQRHYLVEFNHAITFVNKIKQRYNTDTETYKLFLEILQTYQRDGRHIEDVYAQVSRLFGHAPDLIAEFKQFLPENGDVTERAHGVDSITQAAADSQAAASKNKKETAAASKKRKAPEPKGAKNKRAAKAESPSGEEAEPPAPVATDEPQTLASAEEVAFFDKVKKYVDDKVTYHEFLKLINLFSQDLIDVPTLLDRAEHFIGNSPEVWYAFKKMVIVDASGNPPQNPRSRQSGYGFGGMIAPDGAAVENTPMLERVKPDMGGPRVKTYGPSYRKLPKTEVNLTCSGRDALCWEVLNDEWVSHPTWAAEDAAPFMAHKKNQYEEQLHKSEEERHEYDYHIEANLRTIALLEPLNNKLQTLDVAERERFNLKAGLGGQSKSIYMRVIKKVYGKELGWDIIRAMHENPHLALPIVLERLKAKDDEWKKAQREWNRVWREQDAKNFYKALDHQGIQFKTTDKKTISAKALVAEAEARRKEQQKLRSQLMNSSSFQLRPHFEFEFSDIEVLKDVMKLVLSYLDRVIHQMPAKDRERVEGTIREVIPSIWMMDTDGFDQEFGNPLSEDEDDMSEDEDDDGEMDSVAGDESEIEKRSKRKMEPADLRKRLLKSVGGKDRERERGGTSTPAPEDERSRNGRSLEGTPATEMGERAETPLPVPDDPEKVAEQVEKDKVQAEAGEQTWVDVQMPAGGIKQDEDVDMEGDAASGSGNGNGNGVANGAKESNVRSIHMDEQDARDKRLKRKGTFYANTNLYTLIRLVQVLYGRLLNCKQAAAAEAAAFKRPINPVAIRLGLAEPDQQHMGVQSGDNPAEGYYGHLLDMSEKLFGAEIDAPTYEETLRVMFGTKAYVMFTLDKVVAAIIKLAQTIAGDMRSQELIALLQRERQQEIVTTRSQIAYRYQAEDVLDDAQLFKVETHPSRGALAITLLAKDDSTIQDSEGAEQDWRNYVDSYVLTHKTEGLPQRVDEPLLKRNLGELHEDPSAFVRQDGLGCRIAIGSYKMFPVAETEDYFHHKRAAGPADPSADAAAKAAAQKRVDAFVEKRLGELGGVSGTTSAA